MLREVFTTAKFAPSDRHEAWANRHWPALAPVFETIPPPEGFLAEVETLYAGQVAVSYHRMSGQTYLRDPRRIRRDGLDHLGILLFLEGGTVGEASGQDFSLSSGEILVGDLGRASMQTSAGGASITLTVPRHVADAHAPGLSCCHGLVVPAGPAAMVFDYMTSLRRHADTLDAETVARFTQVGLQLLNAAIQTATDRVDPLAEPSDEALFWRARRMIELQLGTRDLSVDLLCARLKVSRSALYRAFAASGGVAGYIQERRLARAHVLLGDAADTRPIHRIAAACGFSEPSALARAFRAAYGLSPSDRREQARDLTRRS